MGVSDSHGSDSKISWKARLMAILMSMQSGQEWQPAHAQMYDIIMDRIGEEWSKRAVQHAVLTEKWRPSPAELLRIAARIASPYPDVDEAYKEIMGKSESLGLYARQHPSRQNIYLEGPPEFSHPIVNQIVESIGGWRSLCMGESKYYEGLHKQIVSAHQRASEKWERAVSEQLSLPDDKRDMRYFPSNRVAELSNISKPVSESHKKSISQNPIEPVDVPKRFSDIDEGVRNFILSKLSKRDLGASRKDDDDV